MPEFPVSQFGGMNQSDQADILITRSHQVNQQGGYTQRFPLESPDLKNLDFDEQGVKPRLGSKENTNLSSILVSGDALLRGIEWENPDTGAKIQLIVSTKSIYLKTGSSWAQINNSNSTAYTHVADASKTTFASLDGHLFIGLDGLNSIQVYKSGDDLDDPLHNNSTTTTVDADSLLSQTLLSVAATSHLIVGDRVRINSGGARDETGYIASISDGISITLAGNLTYTHTAVQADEVIIENLYEESYTDTTHAVTGTWLTATYILAAVNNRLVWTNSNTLLEYSPLAHTASSGIWDRAGSTSGFYQAGGNIKAMINFIPQFTDSLFETLYVGTDNGMEVTTGFSATDRLIRIEGSKPPINHMSFAKGLNWLFYLSEDSNIYAINGATILDIGRRLKNTDLTGVLDSMNVVNTRAYSFGVYNAQKEQIQFYLSSAVTTKNDVVAVIDMKLGEPVPREPQIDFERRLRILIWKIEDASDNDWFVHVYKNADEITGVESGGRLFTTETGDIDIRKDKTVTAATLTTPIVVTVVAHGYTTGDKVRFADVDGMTELNGNRYTLTKLTADTFSLDDTDLNDFTAYTSGGTAKVGEVIVSYWNTPQFQAPPFISREKIWTGLTIRTITLGNWNMKVDYTIDKRDVKTQTVNMAQYNPFVDAVFDTSEFDNDNFTLGGLVRYFNDVLITSEVLQIKFYNENASEPFRIKSFSLAYEIGAEVN